MAESANLRHGLALPAQRVSGSFAEPPGLVNVAVPERPEAGWQTASGGIARSAEQAELAAVGEALERYSAFACDLPRYRHDEVEAGPVLPLEEFSLYSSEQRRAPGFPHAGLYDREPAYVKVSSAVDNREAFAPAALVGLRSDGAGVATSSGLAAGPSPLGALRRAVQELVERDALAVTWLHGIPGRQVPLPERLLEEVRRLGGEVACIDATPAYSAHPVAFVAGHLPLQGLRRYSLGAACRETWEAAVDKAYLEWVQGAVFAGAYREFHPGLHFRSARDVKTFDDHAVYYTVRPKEWKRIPLLQGPVTEQGSHRPIGSVPFAALVRGLARRGIRLFYRDVSTPDLRQIGVYAVRALSPDLVPIHCDEQWPFLGGTARDVSARYPWVDPTRLRFPNPHPHPLG